MEKEILDLFMKKGFLLDKETLNIFKKIEDIETINFVLEKLKENSGERVINKSFFIKNAQLIHNFSVSPTVKGKKTIEKLLIELGVGIEIIREKIEKYDEKIAIPEINGLKVINVGQSTNKKISVEDFVKHFRNRYNFMKKILQDRMGLQNLVSINKTNTNKQFSIIGIVYEKRITKNKNFLLKIEDPSGMAIFIVNKNNSEVYEKAKEVLLDDVIGLRCTSSGDLFFINDILYPDISIPTRKKINEDISIAFTSDTHVGSKVFLEENFLKFIQWLNGEVGDKEKVKEALKIKYLFITGDTVDGVGVYPGQEHLLEIKDITHQYEKLAELLSKIRKDVKIILCPGQHDAVRVAEPQPLIGEDYGSALYNLDNLLLVGNPSLVEIKGIKILIYHGASMINIINEIDELRLGKAHDTPAKVVRYMLKKRHLAPTHSLTTYIPSADDDLLMIKESPDIITTGDLHKPDVDVYNNVLIVSSSCWQSTTPFEEKVGNHPDPCKVPVLNLKTGNIKILDFS